MGGAAGVTPASSRPAAPVPAAAARARQVGDRSSTSPAQRPSLSPRCRGSGLAFPLAVQRWLDCRRRRALLTRSSTAPDRLLKSGRAVAYPLAAALTRVSRPTQTAECDWLARRLSSTSCPDWLPRGPLTNRTAHPPLRFGLPPPQPRFHPGGRGAGRARMEREPPMEAQREGRRVCLRGKAQPMGVRFTSRAPERPPWRLAFRRVAPRATPGFRPRGRGAHSNSGKDAARTGGGDCGRPLWRAPALPTWGPAP